MREDFVADLRCLDDDVELKLADVELRDGEDIITGQLACPHCGRRHAIQYGVPSVLGHAKEGEKKSHFGKQWRWFLEGKFEDPEKKAYGEDRAFIINDFFEMTGLTPETLRGKRILDAGSGASKIAYHLMQEFPDIPFEVVCLEMSDSVYAAVRRTVKRRAPHVRASIYEPGLRKESMDVVYCAGVLHHTPTPRSAFAALVPLLKPGGIMSTWMYSKKFNPFLDATALVWPVTRHLPPKVVLLLAYAFSPFFWIAFRMACAYKAIAKPTSWRWKWIMPLSFATIRLYLFDYMHTYYRFRYRPEEIVRWYEETGFTDIVVLRSGSTAIRAVKRDEARQTRYEKVDLRIVCRG